MIVKPRGGMFEEGCSVLPALGKVCPLAGCLEIVYSLSCRLLNQPASAEVRPGDLRFKELYMNTGAKEPVHHGWVVY